MKITKMLAVGNGEKCPYCDVILDKDIAFLHIRHNHEKEMMKALFETDDKE